MLQTSHKGEKKQSLETNVIDNPFNILKTLLFLKY